MCYLRPVEFIGRKPSANTGIPLIGQLQRRELGFIPKYLHRGADSLPQGYEEEGGIGGRCCSIDLAAVCVLGAAGLAARSPTAVCAASPAKSHSNLLLQPQES